MPNPLSPDNLEVVGSAAVGVLFVHNHPSGNTVPSQEDIQITRRLVEAGKIVGI